LKLKDRWRRFLNKINKIFIWLDQLLHSATKQNILKIRLNKLTITFQLIHENFLINYLFTITRINATCKMLDNKQIQEISPNFVFELFMQLRNKGYFILKRMINNFFKIQFYEILFMKLLINILSNELENSKDRFISQPIKSLIDLILL
jgi:hypothetical protein